MKKVLFLLVLAITLTVCAAASAEMAPALIFKFDSAEAVSQFANNSIKGDVAFEDGCMKVSISASMNNGDQFVGHRFPAGNTYADDYRYVKYRFRTDVSPRKYNGQFFFKTSAVETMGPDSYFAYSLIQDAEQGEWQTYILPVHEHGLWRGELEIFRIDSLQAYDNTYVMVGDCAYVDYLAFFATLAEAEAYNGESPDVWVCPEGIEPEDVSISADDLDQIVWEFENEAEIDKWSPGGYGGNNPTQQIIGVSNGILGVWDDDDNYNMQYTLPEEEQFTLEKFPFVKIRFREQETIGMQLYFWNDAQTENPYFTTSPMYTTSWQTMVIDFTSGSPSGMGNHFQGDREKYVWKGVLNKFRFDPMRAFKRNYKRWFYIDYIGFFKTREAADAYAADRNTDFGGDGSILLKRGALRAIVPANSFNYDTDVFAYFADQDEVGSLNADSAVFFNDNGTEKIISAEYFNSKYLTYVASRPGTYTIGKKTPAVYGDIEGHWADAEIQKVSDNGLFNGTAPNEFSPDMVFTRGMFITVLGRFSGCDVSAYAGNSVFEDVNPAEYYAPYINWAADIGVIPSSGLFRPEEYISRSEMAIIIDSYTLCCGYAIEVPEGAKEKTFSDVSALSQDVKDALGRLTYAGIINGKSATEFDPDGMLTRAEAATVLYRLSKGVLKCANFRDYKRYNAREMTVPYWKGGTVYYESFMPIRTKADQEIEIQLMYDIDRVISLTDSFLDVKYTEGVDYTVRDGKLYIPVDSSIKCYPMSVFRPTTGSYMNVETGGFLYTGGSGKSHSMQLAVTYTHSDSWNSYYPVEDPAKLANFKQKLRNGEDVTIALFGDSISTGCDSSGLASINLPPYLPKFIDLAAECLSDKYGCKVSVINRSVGGKFASWAAEEATNLFQNDDFDLFIIAFGMNDGTLKVDPDNYIANIASVMTQVRAINPECEFLLISTTLPNPESTFWKDLTDEISYHEAYQPLLEELAAEYGDSADIFKLTSMHKYILERKRFIDATSSNVNHPNDFLIRLYTQGILELTGGYADN